MIHSHAMSKKRTEAISIVLQAVVDDKFDNCLVLKKVLEDTGYIIHSFTDPLLALKNYRINFYDLLVLDVLISQMNGIELYQQIRKIDTIVKVCFLAAGRFDRKAFSKICHDLNENRFIQMPIENEELIKRINKIINEYY